jgi:hypothetical protein
MPFPVYEVPTELYRPAGVIGGRTPRQATILLVGLVLGGLCVLVPALLRWAVPVVHDPFLGFPLPLSLVPGGLVFLAALVLQIEDWDGLPMTTWVSLAWRYWRMPKETLLWRPEWGPSPAPGETVQRQHVQVERIAADALVVPEGRRAVLQLDRMPSLGMATEDEQFDVVRRFGRWLNGLHGLAERVQVLLVAGDDDTRGHLRAKRARRFPGLPETMRQYGEEYERLIAELGNSLLRRRHYVVVPEPHAADRDLEALVGDLMRGIRRVGPEPIRLGGGELRALLRDQWRPGERRPTHRMPVHAWTRDQHAPDSTAIAAATTR